MEFIKKLNGVLETHQGIQEDISRPELIRHCIENKEVVVAPNGALTTVTPVESSGRSPKDTYIVRRPEIEDEIDWDAPNNIPLDPETFDMVLEDALKTIESEKTLYISNRVVGADSSYALPIKTITYRATGQLFVYNMFRPSPDDIETSCFINRPFTLIVLPYTKLDRKKYEGRLRKLPDGRTSDMVVAMDVVNYTAVVYGSGYMGSAKKSIFTVMNYYLPAEGILPLHCSANEGEKGDIAILAGLSGTGKTTLSADPTRALLGDDEHGWSDNGIANFEFGCYAKLIYLDPTREPEIYKAITHEAPVEEHGAIVENAMMYPDRGFDFYDNRLTENSRGSYPLTFLSNTKPSSVGGHPSRILFLTADANGVLPPVSKLDENQAMLWFIMGYTSKLAGTETGIKDPVSTFSRFFGAPFMPRNPDVYANMLGERMKKHHAQVFLINTGWSGGPYGVGKRIDINDTRAIVAGVLETELEGVEYVEDKRFHIMAPTTFPGVETEILDPKNTWQDKDAFEKRANQLAEDFSKFFDKAYGNKNIEPEVVACCPGK
jgi:phosphoenolpyruvate carboxykinase (ATP)